MLINKIFLLFYHHELLMPFNISFNAIKYGSVSQFSIDIVIDIDFGTGVSIVTCIGNGI